MTIQDIVIIFFAAVCAAQAAVWLYDRWRHD